MTKSKKYLLLSEMITLLLFFLPGGVAKRARPDRRDPQL